MAILSHFNKDYPTHLSSNKCYSHHTYSHRFKQLQLSLETNIQLFDIIVLKDKIKLLENEYL